MPSAGEFIVTWRSLLFYIYARVQVRVEFAVRGLSRDQAPGRV